MATEKSWRLFCSHGIALFYIAQHPDCTVQDISDALVVTPRTAWSLIGDLRRAGLMKVRKDGRRHRYSLDGDGRLPDPVLSHLTLGQIMRVLTS